MSETILKLVCHLAAPPVHWMMSGDWSSSPASRMDEAHSRLLVLNAPMP